MEKTKVTPINLEQKKMMVEYLTKYPDLAKQKFSNDFTFKKARKHWEELSGILNSIPGGSKKTWLQWRKTWTDLKKNTKHKLSVLKQHTQGTGGGPAISDTLTDLEKTIIEIIGTIVQEGHEDIVETPVEFQFDDYTEDNNDLDSENIYLNPTPSLSKNNDHSYNLNPEKLLSGGGNKRLTVTRRLENSQKIGGEMLKTMEGRNMVIEDYYSAKKRYYEHMEEYHKQKIEVLRNVNKIASEILVEVKSLKTIFM